ncbi:MAG: DNA/RNA non-specific endonuclease [Bacteroidales bacterium]|jgi:endonuclease G|nr:DNA/RNA non-specific endonuclease [Bacteroidales bacterium]
MNSSFTSWKTNIILILMGLIIVIGLAVQCSPILQNKDDSENVSNDTMEVLSNDTLEPPSDDKIEIPSKITEREEQIINHLGYTVSYNPGWKIPNWVAYELTEEELTGNAKRKDNFMPDPAVIYEMSATTSDYYKTGWHRGHMVPAADMQWSEQAMAESFYFSNICPQNGSLNTGIWKTLENRVRDLALEKGNIYIVCGPIVSKEPKTIGGNKVVVPDAFFKVLLQNENGNWFAIGFIFANQKGHGTLSTYAKSVKEIQTVTNIDFFPALPDSIEEKI